MKRQKPDSEHALSSCVLESKRLGVLSFSYVSSKGEHRLRVFFDSEAALEAAKSHLQVNQVLRKPRSSRSIPNGGVVTLGLLAVPGAKMTAQDRADFSRVVESFTKHTPLEIQQDFKTLADKICRSKDIRRAVPMAKALDKLLLEQHQKQQTEQDEPHEKVSKRTDYVCRAMIKSGKNKDTAYAKVWSAGNDFLVLKILLAKAQLEKGVDLKGKNSLWGDSHCNDRRVNAVHLIQEALAIKENPEAFEDIKSALEAISKFVHAKQEKLIDVVWGELIQVAVLKAVQAAEVLEPLVRERVCQIGANSKGESRSWAQLVSSSSKLILKMKKRDSQRDIQEKTTILDILADGTDHHTQPHQLAYQQFHLHHEGIGQPHDESKPVKSVCHVVVMEDCYSNTHIRALDMPCILQHTCTGTLKRTRTDNPKPSSSSS